MTTELQNCPNCQTKVTGVFNNNLLLSEKKNNIINAYGDEPEATYCNKCGDELFRKVSTAVLSERRTLISEIENLISAIPVISIHTPLNWDYEIVDMVTAQSTTGTGVISEIASSFTDLFGMQSGTLNSKLLGGENLCFAQLRKKAVDLGSNAIIATDIDYSEIGGSKGILMVCMGGTAVRLKNINILGEQRSQRISKIFELNDRLNFLHTVPIEEYL